MITRPRKDAETLVELLSRRGVGTVVDPMLEIVLLTLPEDLDLESVQALLVTSANGARALSTASRRRDIPLLTVGPTSAMEARREGFRDVTAADGNVRALADLVRRRLDPGGGRLVHVTGRVVAGDLSGTLAADGFEVDRIVLYEAQAAKTLSAETVESLTEGTLDAVLFFSPGTAATFARLIGQAGLTETVVRVRAFCLSPAVVQAASKLAWRSICTAVRSDQAAMIDLACAGPVSEMPGAKEPT